MEPGPAPAFSYVPVTPLSHRPSTMQLAKGIWPIYRARPSAGFFAAATCFSQSAHRTQRRLSRQKDLTPYREPAMRGFFVVSHSAASFVVVAQLSPEFTAQLVDRWQELEKQVAKPAFDFAAALSVPTHRRRLLTTAAFSVRCRRSCRHRHCDQDAKHADREADNSVEPC
jgi:hypothetical protein